MLENLEIFNSLNQSELDELALFCQKKSVSKWEKLFSVWDPANTLYIVVSGLIDVVDEDNKSIWNISEGDILWEMAILWWEDARTASAIALSDASLVTILGFSMEKLAERHEEIFEKIQRIITKRRQENIDM